MERTVTDKVTNTSLLIFLRYREQLPSTQGRDRKRERDTHTQGQRQREREREREREGDRQTDRQAGLSLIHI